jgi:hypothetical protein
MELAPIYEQLVLLAREAGLAVRELRAGGEGEPVTTSGVCRLRGETWVLLAPGDSLEQRIDLLARALESHAGPALEGRYLPPAVRERLNRARRAG